MSENSNDTSIALSFTIPLSFLEIKKEADKIVEKDPSFKDFLGSIDPRYAQKTKQNKFKSLKMRYYIYHYLKTRAKYLEGGKNAEKSESDSTKKENPE